MQVRGLRGNATDSAAGSAASTPPSKQLEIQHERRFRESCQKLLCTCPCPRFPRWPWHVAFGTICASRVMCTRPWRRLPQPTVDGPQRRPGACPTCFFHLTGPPQHCSSTTSSNPSGASQMSHSVVHFQPSESRAVTEPQARNMALAVKQIHRLPPITFTLDF
ncbi:hypothetical protein BDW02DRAFT_130900 [Decorospora gaudefroyi]|uniref:Uncharacterized protein n=1 Tax=Decorospora gaudefroyi TaxID=184978 RepID=A0A6A5KV60_9PLEO|nr:hypothetical protein BDW02DRAFT_130900 [Decorospora gaudefroyi]